MLRVLEISKKIKQLFKAWHCWHLIILLATLYAGAQQNASSCVRFFHLLTLLLNLKIYFTSSISMLTEENNPVCYNSLAIVQCLTWNLCLWHGPMHALKKVNEISSYLRSNSKIKISPGTSTRKEQNSNNVSELARPPLVANVQLILQKGGTFLKCTQNTKSLST